jgi:hypothetical protein
MLTQNIGVLDVGERSEGADLNRAVGLLANAFQFRDAADVEHVLRREQLLLHRGQQVGAAGQDANVTGMLGQQCDRFRGGVRTQEFELGEAQSAPPGCAR